jgi:hypothetical protein
MAWRCSTAKVRSLSAFADRLKWTTASESTSLATKLGLSKASLKSAAWPTPVEKNGEVLIAKAKAEAGYWYARRFNSKPRVETFLDLNDMYD